MTQEGLQIKLLVFHPELEQADPANGVWVNLDKSLCGISFLHGITKTLPRDLSAFIIFLPSPFTFFQFHTLSLSLSLCVSHRHTRTRGHTHTLTAQPLVSWQQELMQTRPSKIIIYFCLSHHHHYEHPSKTKEKNSFDSTQCATTDNDRLRQSALRVLPMVILFK